MQIKIKVYTEKRKLKNTSIFLTEDMTKYRQGIVQELTKAKREGKVYSYWTNDGRIFVKCHERGRKQLIRSFNDLHRIV
jgi:CTP-dependent riboflavin kinase